MSPDRKTCRCCGTWLHVWEGEQCISCDPIEDEEPYGPDDSDYIERPALGRTHPAGNRAAL
jgi:hypothetical protein